MKIGDTFFFEHLWVVVTPPALDGSVIAVNFTSLKNSVCDDSCVIEPGEHPFVKHPTGIAYGSAKTWTKEQQAFIENQPGRCPPQQPVSAKLLRRIQDGALKSDLTAQKVQVRIVATIEASETR